jgi:signal recognition particle subunit SRP54
MNKLGPIGKVMEMIPGGEQLTAGMSGEEMESQMGRTKAMILSMTPKERVHPELIDHSRRRRIAKGSGTGLDEVNQLLKEFKLVRKQFKEMGKGGGLMGAMARRGFRKRKEKQLKELKKAGGALPFDLPGFGAPADGGGRRRKDKKKKKKRR